MKKYLILAMFVTALAVSTLGATAFTQQASDAFKFVAIGDTPYTLPADYPRFERLISSINAAKPSFTVHAGDIKSGSSECSDANILKIRDYFNTFENPLIYAVGDNEWTDCHREKAGKFDPLERLGKLREWFFAKAQSLGKTPMPLERQADVSEFKQMVENARWSKNGVLFATLNIPGSNNGFERNLASSTEYFERDKANVAWIKETFAKATASNAPAVVFTYQADMMFKNAASGDYSNAGYKNTLAAFAAGAKAFKKPVLLIHGDSHVFTIDQPLLDADGVTVLENVTRLEVFGEKQIQGVEVLVDPNSSGVFGFRPLIVTENMNPVK
jgi:hypothetical protein